MKTTKIMNQQKAANSSLLTFLGNAQKKRMSLSTGSSVKSIERDQMVQFLLELLGGRVVVVNKARRITISVDMFVLDDEWFSDETRREQQTNTAVLSGTGISQSVMDFEIRMGGEIRVLFQVTASLFDDYGNAMVNGDIKLFEGTSESTDDLDGQKQFQLYVPAGVTTNYFVRVNNDDEGGDYVTTALTVSNTAA